MVTPEKPKESQNKKLIYNDDKRFPKSINFLNTNIPYTSTYDKTRR